jgi:hypothetical protein
LLEFGLGRRLRSGCEGDLTVGVGNDDALDGLDPFGAAVDAGAGVDGAEDGVGIGPGLIGMLDEEFGGKAQVPAAALVKPLGARVAIDGVVIRELVLISDQVGIAPIDELFFYVGTVRVMADGTFARVAIEGGGCGRLVAVRAGGLVGVAMEGFGYELGGVSPGDDLGEMCRWGLALELGLGFVFALGGTLGNYSGQREGGRSCLGFGRRVRTRCRFRFWLQF